MTDIEKNGPVSPTEPEPKSLPSRLGGRDRLLRSGDEGRPASHRRTISAAMMQALEDDMDRRPGVYERLAAS